MSRLLIPKLYVRPDSAIEIAQRVKSLLIRGDCLGILPTPIEHLYHVAEVEEIELDRDEIASMWGRFSAAARDMVTGLMNRVRGAADIKKRVVFMPRDDAKPRILFARAHELGHQVLPWHYLNTQYLDNDQTLSPQIKDRFEVEANLCAADILFQGERFQDMARQYRPEFASIFELARLHGASIHATFWHFIEVHDDAVSGIIYYPVSKESSPLAVQAGFIMQNEVRSARFRKFHASLTFDGRLDFRHEWAQARLVARQPVIAEIPMMMNGCPEPFLWEAFWNGYCLMVLVRRRPALRLVGRSIRRAPWN